ncbi:MAG: STAS domain-containing protein [Gammaproteobacteria bacterium]|nr:STAS domain-containing protein [Gammaproteobacteria bacterium]
MDIQRTFEASNKRVTISVRGRFDFALYKAFRESYRDVDTTVREYVVDLRHATSLDSAALGMLLLLREHATSLSATVAIRGAIPEVSRVLDIAKFRSLFHIS